MYIKTASATDRTLERCIETLITGFRGFDPSLLVFFASSRFGESVSPTMARAFPDATLFGCSTAGELTSGRMTTGSISAMGFSREAVGEVCVRVVERLGANGDVSGAFRAFERHFAISPHDMEPAHYVGIVLVDGLCGGEERLMDRIGDLTMVPFIGGSAGDDLEFKKTLVFADGKSYTNAAILALLRPRLPFACIKTQSFVPRREKLVVTSAHEASRQVVSFNGIPAVRAYAEALGVPPEEVARHFMHNPLGLVVDGIPFVRSPQRVQGDSLLFYCGVKEGMELALLESTDIIADTRAALERAKSRVGTISGLLVFDCILRTLELRQRGLTAAYGRLFGDVPTAGFSTYGEQYIGHINQTATMLLFGSPPEAEPGG